MSVVTIPMSETPAFKQETTLDGRPYILEFRWNTRGSFWTMSISDRDETVLVSDLKLVIAFPLKMRHISDNRLPPGEFFCIDTQLSTMMNDPGRNDFIQDRKLELVYVGEGE